MLAGHHRTPTRRADELQAWACDRGRRHQAVPRYGRPTAWSNQQRARGRTPRPTDQPPARWWCSRGATRRPGRAGRRPTPVPLTSTVRRTAFKQFSCFACRVLPELLASLADGPRRPFEGRPRRPVPAFRDPSTHRLWTNLWNVRPTVGARRAMRWQSRWRTSDEQRTTTFPRCGGG